MMAKTDNRRKLLKSLLAGTSAVVAGKSMPDAWLKPIVNSVMLPAHAQTTGVFSQTLGFEFDSTAFVNLIPNQAMIFALNGVVPNGPGTVTITNLAGDLNGNPMENWTIEIGATELGQTNNSTLDCRVAPGSVFNVSLAELQAAVLGGNITITAINGGDIQDFCGNDLNETNTTMDVTLTFPSAPA